MEEADSFVSTDMEIGAGLEMAGVKTAEELAIPRLNVLISLTVLVKGMTSVVQEQVHTTVNVTKTYSRN